MAGLITPEQAELIKADPRAAFSNPKVASAIAMVAQHSGLPSPDFGKIVQMHESGTDFGWARGRKVSAFDHVCGERAVEGLTKLGLSGRAMAIKFRFDVDFSWHPVESQRSLIWAGKFGKQEELVDVLARKHFEEGRSVNHRSTLLAAAKEVDLDLDALVAFLDTDEEEAAVWQSYTDTTNKHGIHSIPYFVFNAENSNGGPFRGNGSGGHIVRGSSNVDEFYSIFELILAESHAKKAREMQTVEQKPSQAVLRIEAALGGFNVEGSRKVSNKVGARPSVMKKGFLLGR
mmetsp:Transcript_30902/g.51159  ORF Transcript_30902/g.51159 Transcript_30902/m.51159 type:complete len:289 (+) Transcript_30902:430-1296(+)